MNCQVRKGFYNSIILVSLLNMEKPLKKIIEVTKTILVLDLILCATFIILLGKQCLSPNMKDIALGFIVASIFTFIGYLITKKVDVIYEFFTSYDDGIWFFLYIFSQAMVVLAIIICIFSAFYIIDYEFINDGLEFFGFEFKFDKPKFLIKLSFIVTSSILAYCYSNLEKEK